MRRSTVMAAAKQNPDGVRRLARYLKITHTEKRPIRLVALEVCQVLFPSRGLYG